MKNNLIENITVEAINDNDIFQWKATIKPPNENQYKDQIFNLNISFKNDYPFSYPDFIFTTNIDHPNFHTNEKISLNILKIENWTPFISIRTILLKIYALLKKPESFALPAPTLAHNHIIYFHRKFSCDNMLMKIQIHFFNFVFEFVDDILKQLNINKRFYNLCFIVKKIFFRDS